MHTWLCLQVSQWFARRADVILLVFDPYKLDISDEFKETINSLKGHEDKVRIVLNKADSVTQKQLIRVYGALMWSLGKLIKTPEVCRYGNPSSTIALGQCVSNTIHE